QSGPLGALTQWAARRGLLPRFAAQGLAMTLPIAPRAERALENVRVALPIGARVQSTDEAVVFSPAGVRKARVLFHTSCVMEPLFPDIHRETVRLLVLAGAEVVVPRVQTCCGALQAHAGLRREAKALARRNVAAFGGTDAVVSHSAGCGAALREAGHLLHDEEGADAAQQFSARVRDVSEVLAELGLPEPRMRLAAPERGREKLGDPLGR